MRRSTLTSILVLLRGEWGRLIPASIFLLAGGCVGLVFPQAVRAIIDGSIRGGGMFPEHAVVTMGALLLVYGVASAGRYILFDLAGERSVARLRERLYRHLLAQDTAFFDEHRTGELATRLGADTQILQVAISGHVSVATQAVVQLLGGMTMLFLISPTLTLTMLALVPPVAVLSSRLARGVERISRDVRDDLAWAGHLSEEAFGGIRTVRAFTAEERMSARYGEVMLRVLGRAYRRSWLGGLIMGATGAASYAAAGVVLWTGGHLVARGSMSAGALASFLAYTLIIASQVGVLADRWTELVRATGAAERIFQLLEQKPVMPLTGGKRLDQVHGRVEFRHVHFAYPTRPDASVLRDISLVLLPGESVALVGPSGSGKSTIASLLARLYDPNSGHVLLDGHDFRELDPVWLRQRVGIVAQEPLLFSGSIAENIGYGRKGATPKEIEDAARAANAHAFIVELPEGYTTQVGERGLALSGGQKQRIAIARAVLKNPRILVLDEATSALDGQNELLVQEAIERLMKGRSTIIIAHRMSTVRGADRVLVLDRGQLVQRGNHSSLVKEDGLYRRLVERQFVA